jgi:hypothetical protein
MKKNNDTSEAVNHSQCNGQMKNEKELHLTIALSLIYSF